ncbi:MAG: hypothetical protein ABIO95_01675 [Bdellovibrionota bacterium]
MRNSSPFIAVLMLVLLSAGSAHAGEFSNTTTGRTEEGADSYGLPSDKALTQRGKNIMKKFKEGRLSSAVKPDSRFSGFLEFHDANLDGVVDHDVSDGNTGLEGNITSTLPKGKDLAERVVESRKAANKGKCGKEEGTWDDGPAGADGKPTQGARACFSPSGVIVDMGAAHGGEKSPHRKLRLSAEAVAAANKAGTQYGEAAVNEIQADMRAEYGLAPNMKVAAIDQLKSEAAWLEEQKENNLERGWKSLRAARLAGFDNAELTSAGQEGAEVMHDVDLMISKGATDRDVAQEIAVTDSIQAQQFVKVGNEWKPYDANDEAQKAALNTADANKTTDPDARKKIQKSFSDLKKEVNNADEIATYHDAAKQIVLEGSEKNEEFQKDITQIEKCMNKETWCNNGKTAEQENDRLEKAAGKPLDNDKRVKKYSEVQGDPGGVFQDTRELIYIKLADAQKAPIDKIESIVTSYDLNRETDPEYFKQIDKLKEDTEGMQKANEARGNKFYDTKTQSVREFSGVRQGVNDSYREENTEQTQAQASGPRPSSVGSTPPVQGQASKPIVGTAVSPSTLK